MGKSTRSAAGGPRKRPPKAPPPETELPPGPRVAQCTKFMQRRVAEHLPGILEQLLKKSRGDAATLKALWQMSKLDEQQGATRKRKGSLAREMLRNE